MGERVVNLSIKQVKFVVIEKASSWELVPQRSDLWEKTV